MRVVWNFLGIVLLSVLVSPVASAQARVIRPGDVFTYFPRSLPGTENKFPYITVCEAISEIPASPDWEFRCQTQDQNRTATGCSHRTVVLNPSHFWLSPMQTGLTEIPMARAGMEVVTGNRIVEGGMELLAGNRIVQASSFGRSQWINPASRNGANLYLVKDQNNCWHPAGSQVSPVQRSQFPPNGFQLGAQVYVSDQELAGAGVDPLNLPLLPTTVVGWAPIREYETCFDDTGAYCRENGNPETPGLPYPVWAEATVTDYIYVLANGGVRRAPLYSDGTIDNYRTEIWRAAIGTEIRDLEMPAPGTRVIKRDSGRVLTVQDILLQGPPCFDVEANCFPGMPLFLDGVQGLWVRWAEGEFLSLDDISSALNVRRRDRIRGNLVVVNGSGDVQSGDEVISAISDAAADHFIARIADQPQRYTFAVTESGKHYILASCAAGPNHELPSGPIIGPLCSAEREGTTRSIYAIPVP